MKSSDKSSCNEIKTYINILADFGVSKIQQDSDKMKTLVGSPYWIAPE